MSDEKQMIVKLAFVYTQNGDWYKAIEEYRKILVLEPNNATMYNSIGDCYARKGDDQDALESYLRAQEMFAQQGNGPKVASIDKKIAKLNPDRMDPRHKGMLRTLQKTAEADQMAQEGHLEDALAHYRQMIETEPANLSYREKLASLFLENAQVSEAADEYRAIASRHLEAGRLEQAKQYAAKAAELDPDSAEQARVECALAEATGDTGKLGPMMERFGKNELEAGHFEAALDCLGKATAAGQAGLEPFVARALLGLKRYPEAREAFQKLHEQTPDDEGVLENLLTLEEQAKDWPSALTHVNALVAAHPEHTGFLLRGARISMQAGKNAEAAQIYMRLAGLSFKEGHYDSVLGYFQSVLAFQPENLEILKKKAELLFKLGKKAETIAAYKDLEKLLAKKAPEEARKVAVLVNRIQSLPDHPSKGTIH